MKTFNATGQAHVGTSGFTNYSPSERRLDRGLKQVFAEMPDCIVIDGDDDWYAPKICKASFVASQAKVQPVAWFHSGVSGMGCTGIVIKASDLKKFKRAFNKARKVEENCAANPSWPRGRYSPIVVYTPDGSETLKA